MTGYLRVRVAFRLGVLRIWVPLLVTPLRILRTWVARSLSTMLLHTARHSQSLWGHVSRRASCALRCRTSVFNLNNSDSRSDADCFLLFMPSIAISYHSLYVVTCHYPKPLSLPALPELAGPHRKHTRPTCRHWQPEGQPITECPVEAEGEPSNQSDWLCH